MPPAALHHTKKLLLIMAHEDGLKEKKNEKFPPLGGMTGASVPRSSPRWLDCRSMWWQGYRNAKSAVSPQGDTCAMDAHSQTFG